MLKSAVIGLGKIGLMYDFDAKRERPSAHVLAYEMNQSFQLAAVVDIRPEQEEPLRQVSPHARFFTDVDELINAHPDLEVISICTTTEGRIDLIAKILESASVKIIFCEKPVASDYSEAKLLMHLVQAHPDKVVIPNLSRRWNKGIIEVRDSILQEKYGALEKIHFRYTRGIFNTGSHIFDLVKFFAGAIHEVKVLQKVETSSDKEGDPTFSFAFTAGNKVHGFAEAFNDDNYYMFEMDLYFHQGKIEILLSGDQIRYYGVNSHPLFHGFKSLVLEKTERNLLKQSNLGQAIEHLANVAYGYEQPICQLIDGVYPILVGDALKSSYTNGGTYKKVGVISE